MDTLKSGSDVLFILIGAVMVLAMHAGFAFLELTSAFTRWVLHPRMMINAPCDA